MGGNAAVIVVAQAVELEPDTGTAPHLHYMVHSIALGARQSDLDNIIFAGGLCLLLWLLFC